MCLIWMKEHENETVPQEEGDGEIKDGNRENSIFFYRLVHGRSRSVLTFKQAWLKQPFLNHFWVEITGTLQTT